MKIELHQIGKRYNKDWIFRNIDLSFQNGIYAILGSNGSGKSTLLQLIIGYIYPSEGSIVYSLHSNPMEPTDVFSHCSLVAPYLELPEELSLKELYQFYADLKPMETKNALDFSEILNLSKHINKPLKYFSSGMKQRVKLGLSILSKSSMCCLDEPLTNLDNQGYLWYKDLLKNYSNNRIVLICSNQEKEYELCTTTIDISTYKQLV